MHTQGKDQTMTNYHDHKALQKLCQAIFGTERNPSNLIGSDFADVHVREIEGRFRHGINGVRIEFVVSNDGLPKVLRSQETADALNDLLGRSGDGADTD